MAEGCREGSGRTAALTLLRGPGEAGEESPDWNTHVVEHGKVGAAL